MFPRKLPRLASLGVLCYTWQLNSHQLSRSRIAAGLNASELFSQLMFIHKRATLLYAPFREQERPFSFWTGTNALLNGSSMQSVITAWTPKFKMFILPPFL